MNKIYKLIWNELTHSWIAVAEFVKSKGKKSAVVIMAISTLSELDFFIPQSLAGPLSPPPQNQLPTEGSVIRGNVSITESPSLMNINQSSSRAVVNWGTFDIGSASTVNFNQPSASAIILNNVLSSNPSQIFGHMNANGQVFFSNPNGMYFSPSANVSVGGLVATTNSISSDDFMAGKNIFYRNGATGSIINEGHLSANLGGYIALLAPEVRNQGIIVAQLGTVIMAAGETYTLAFKNGTSLSNIYVSASTLNSLVSNGEAIYAPGGLIIMSAKAANHIQGGVINNTGLIEASGLVNHGGVIRLEASKEINQNGNIKANAASNGNGGKVTLIADLSNSASLVKVAGSISAEGGNLGGHGGFIETSGSKVKIEDGAMISTRAPLGKNGEYLIDPVDFLISAAGGDVTGNQVSALLNITNVTYEATNNIDVNDRITWSQNSLTLKADNHININQTMFLSNTASLTLAKLTSEESPQINITGIPLNIDGVNYGNLIANLDDLQDINNNTSNYAIVRDIHATSLSNPIVINNFTNILNGLNHKISNVNLDSDIDGNLGLFAKIPTDVTIKNLKLDNFYIDGTDISNNLFTGTGALAGFNEGNIDNVHITDSDVIGLFNTGGIVGYNKGTINNSSFEGSVGLVGLNLNTGGLVGYNTGTINNSSVVGDINGGLKVGGLAGNNFGGSINNSSITGNVTGGFKVGGLAGSDGFSLQNAGELIDSGISIDNITTTNILSSQGSIKNSHITGNVSGLLKVGGLTSLNLGTIDNSYITGDVSGSIKVGGLTGLNIGSVSRSSVNGNISGGLLVGGLTVTNLGTISQSNVNGDVNGIALIGGLAVINGPTGIIADSYVNGNVSGTFSETVSRDAVLNLGSITYTSNQDRKDPVDLSMVDLDTFTKRKKAMKINSDEVINYDAVRSGITVRAKVIVH